MQQQQPQQRGSPQSPSTSPSSEGRGMTSMDLLHNLLQTTGACANKPEQDESLVLLHPDYLSEVQRGNMRALGYSRRRLPLLVDLALGRLGILEGHREALWRARRSACGTYGGDANAVAGRESTSLLDSSADSPLVCLPCSATSLSPPSPPPFTAAEVTALANTAVRLLCGKSAWCREGAVDAQNSTLGPVLDPPTTRYFFAHYRDEVDRICGALGEACERLERVVPIAMLAPPPKRTKRRAHSDVGSGSASNGASPNSTHPIEEDADGAEDWLPLPAAWNGRHAGPRHVCHKVPDVGVVGGGGGGGGREGDHGAGARTGSSSAGTMDDNAQSRPTTARPAPLRTPRTETNTVSAGAEGTVSGEPAEVATSPTGTGATTATGSIHRLPLSELPHYLDEQCGIIQNALLMLESLLVAVVAKNSFLSMHVGNPSCILSAPRPGASAGDAGSGGCKFEPDPFAVDLSSPTEEVAGGPGVEEDGFMRRTPLRNGQVHGERSAASPYSSLPSHSPTGADSPTSTSTGGGGGGTERRGDVGTGEDAVKFVTERATQSFMKVFLSITTIENQLAKYSRSYERHHGLCVAAVRADGDAPAEERKDVTEPTREGSATGETAVRAATSPPPDINDFIRFARAVEQGPSQDCDVCRRFYTVEQEVAQHVNANMNVLKLATIAIAAHDTDISEAAINYMDSQDVVFTAQATMLLAHVLTPELLAAHPTDSRGGKALRWMLGFVFGAYNSEDVVRIQHRRQMLRVDSNPFSIADSSSSSYGGSNCCNMGGTADASGLGPIPPHHGGGGSSRSGGEAGSAEGSPGSLHNHQRQSLLDPTGDGDNDGILGGNESDFSFASSDSSGNEVAMGSGPDLLQRQALADSYGSVGLRVEYVLGACFTRCHPLMAVVGTIAENNSYECGTVVAKAVLQYAVTLSHTSARLLRTPLLTTRWSTPFTEAMMRGLNKLAMLTQDESVLLGSAASSYSSCWTSTTTDSEKMTRLEERERDMRELEEAAAAAAVAKASAAASPDRVHSHEEKKSASHAPHAGPSSPSSSSRRPHSHHASPCVQWHGKPTAKKGHRRSHKGTEHGVTLQRAAQSLNSYLHSYGGGGGGGDTPASDPVAAGGVDGASQSFCLPPVVRPPPLTRVYVEKRRHRFRPRPRGKVTGTTAADCAETACNRTLRRNLALQWAKCVILSARTLIKAGITKVPVPREHYDTLYHQSKRLQGMLNEWFAITKQQGPDSVPKDAVPGHLESARPFSVVESKTNSSLPLPQQQQQGGEGERDKSEHTKQLHTEKAESSAADAAAATATAAGGKEPVGIPMAHASSTSSPQSKNRRVSIATTDNGGAEALTASRDNHNSTSTSNTNTLPSCSSTKTKNPQQTVVNERYQRAFAHSFCFGKNALELFTESPYVNVPVHEVLFASFFTIFDAISDVMLCEQPRLNTIFVNEVVTLLYEVRLSMLEARSKVELITPHATRFRSLTERDAVMHDAALSPYELLFPAEYGVLMEKAFRCSDVIQRWRVELEKNPNHPAAGFASLLHHLYRKLMRYEHPTEQELLISRATLRLLLGVTARDEAGDIHGNVLHVDDLDVEGTKKEDIAPRLGVAASMDGMRGSRDDLQQLIHKQNIDVGVYRTPSHSRRSSVAATPIPSDDDERAGALYTPKPEGDEQGRHSTSCSTCSDRGSDDGNSNSSSNSSIDGERSQGRHRRSAGRSRGSCFVSPSSSPLGMEEADGSSKPPHPTAEWLTRINEGEGSFYNDSLAASPLLNSKQDGVSFPTVPGEQQQEQQEQQEQQQEEDERKASTAGGVAGGSSEQHIREDEGSSAAAADQGTACVDGGATHHDHHHHHHHHQTQQFSPNHMAPQQAVTKSRMRRPHSIKVIGNAQDMFVMAQRAPATWAIPSAGEILRRSDRQELAKEPALAQAIVEVHTKEERSRRMNRKDEAEEEAAGNVVFATSSVEEDGGGRCRRMSPVLNNACIEQKRFVAAGGRSNSNNSCGSTPVTPTPPGAMPKAQDDTLYILQIFLPTAPSPTPTTSASAAHASGSGSEALPSAEPTWGDAAAVRREDGNVEGAGRERVPGADEEASSSPPAPETADAAALPTGTTPHEEKPGEEEEEDQHDDDDGTEWNLRRFDPNRPAHWAPPPGTLPAVKVRHGLSLAVLSPNHHLEKKKAAQGSATEAAPKPPPPPQQHQPPAPPKKKKTKAKKSRQVANTSFDLSRLPNARRLLATMDSADPTGNKSFSFFTTDKALLVSSEEDEEDEEYEEEGSSAEDDDVARANPMHDSDDGFEDHDDGDDPLSPSHHLHHHQRWGGGYGGGTGTAKGRSRTVLCGDALSASAPPLLSFHPSEKKRVSPSAGAGRSGSGGLPEDKGERVPVSTETATAAASIVRDFEREHRRLGANGRDNLLPFPITSLPASRKQSFTTRADGSDKDGTRQRCLSTEGDDGGSKSDGAAPATTSSPELSQQPDGGDSDTCMSPVIPKRLRGETFAFGASYLTESTEDLVMTGDRAAGCSTSIPNKQAETDSVETSTRTPDASTEAAAAAAGSHHPPHHFPHPPHYHHVPPVSPYSHGYTSSTGSTPPNFPGPSMLRSCFTSGRAYGGVTGPAMAAMRAPFCHRPPSSPTASLDSATSPSTPVGPPPPPSSLSGGSGSSPSPPSASAMSRAETATSTVAPLTNRHLSTQQQQQQQQQDQPHSALPSAMLGHKSDHYHPMKRVQFASLPQTSPPAHAPPPGHGGSAAGVQGLHSGSSSFSPSKTTSHASSENLSDLST